MQPHENRADQKIQGNQGKYGGGKCLHQHQCKFRYFVRVPLNHQQNKQERKRLGASAKPTGEEENEGLRMLC